MYRPSSVLTSGGVEMTNMFLVASLRSMSAASLLSQNGLTANRLTLYTMG